MKLQQRVHELAAGILFAGLLASCANPPPAERRAPARPDVAAAKRAPKVAPAPEPEPEEPKVMTIYVSPRGDDGNKGTKDGPFQTLERAREEVRTIKAGAGLPEGGVRVELAAGVYERSKPFDLTNADSGEADRRVVYAAARGAEVRIVGGKVVKGFERPRDRAALARVDEAARGTVLVADLEAQGLTDYGQLEERGFGRPVHVSHMELFFQDKPMTLARWPNGEYARMVGLPDGKDGKRFHCEEDRPARWVDEPDLWVYGYWYHDWADTYMKVKSVDAQKRIVETVNKHNYGLRDGHRWHALNALSELDAPGEYYIDREKGLLYFWPPADITAGVPMVSVTEKLVTMKDTSYVTVRGMILEACRGTAVDIVGGSHSEVVGCVIRNIGNRAVTLQGTDHAVIGCDITETGDGGVFLWGGDRKTLTPARLRAENNHIWNFSRWSHTYRPAVGVGGCGNIVRHNLLHHGPHNAIQLGGNDHVIEYNEVHSVCSDTGDVGAFYMGRDWTARGTVIRHNYWHHIQGPGRIGAMGVYLDDQASGIHITGNLFYRVTRAMFVGGGVDNIITNNCFVECNPSVHIDARGLGWQKKATDDPEATLRTRLRSMPYQDELWSKRYPNLVGILNDDPGTPKRNVVKTNISIGGRWDNIHHGTRTYQTVENNLVDEDPHFVDSKGLDFRLKPDSPALAMGFEPLPIDKMGVYEDDRRASWPVKHSAREVPVSSHPDRPAAPKGPKPVYVATRLHGGVQMTGAVSHTDWEDHNLELKEDLEGTIHPRRSRAWVRRDDAHLYVAFENDVKATPPIKRESKWGGNDAVEIAIRNSALGKKAPIIVLRGFVSGTFECTGESGAPAAVVKRAEQGVVYEARVPGPKMWTCEWKIPFRSLGIDPAKHTQLEFNLSVRKTADDLWLMLRSTRGHTWWVDRAAILKLAP